MQFISDSQPTEAEDIIAIMTPSPTKELMSATPTISRRPREEFAEKVSWYIVNIESIAIDIDIGKIWPKSRADRFWPKLPVFPLIDPTNVLRRRSGGKAHKQIGLFALKSCLVCLPVPCSIKYICTYVLDPIVLPTTHMCSAK